MLVAKGEVAEFPVVTPPRRGVLGVNGLLEVTGKVVDEVRNGKQRS